MKRVELYLYSCLVIQIFCVLSVESISDNVPLVSSDPCGLPKDITVWSEPNLSEEKIRHLFIKINRHIPANSEMRVTFDAQFYIFLTYNTNDWTWKQADAGENLAIPLSESQTGFSFVVRGFGPGRVTLLSLSIGGVEQCDVLRLKAHWGGNLTDSQCGRRRIHPNGVTDPISGLYLPQDTGSVVNGPAVRGHWPWHVGIYEMRKFTRQTAKYYICGGTLVSNTFVLTAAHYVKKIEVKSMEVQFGNQYITWLSSEYDPAKANVAEVIIPKTYNETYYLNDIALLKLKSKVKFTEFIRPACLWDRRQSDLTDTKGVLVGWGDLAMHSVSIQQVNLPMVSDETCTKSNPTFYSSHLNGNNFCAENLNEKVLCKLDGGAFQVFIADQAKDNGKVMSGAWYVRGVLSHYVFLDKPVECSWSTYPVFTDVEKFSDWLGSYLSFPNKEKG